MTTQEIVIPNTQIISDTILDGKSSEEIPSPKPNDNDENKTG